ncbi:metal-dependent hydrolase [Mycobacteroides chelonae]|uniref:metal-dependent hydrolase n=1 Tax=Mycobacteroides chelonae TaxID=1774 RepID=UPI0009933590|nr:metal-dependent hydrolase [Mycobacteroides chelonae]
MSTVEDATTVAVPPSKPPRVIRRTSASFPVRKIGNDYRDVGAKADALIPGQPMIAQLFCGISMFFPPGERFMIAAAKSIQDQVQDPKLRADIDAFARQEAQHASEHSRANRVLAAQAGWDSDKVCREINAIWLFIEKHCSPRVRAGFTAATEHFTAIISEILLTDLEFVDAVPESKGKQMLLWHAIEECEHKAVVFDAYKEVGGSELERLAIMAVYTVPVFVAAMFPFIRLVIGHGHGTDLKGWAKGFATFGRRWGLPFATKYLRYYQPGFHPDHLPTGHLEQYWIKKLGVIDDGKKTTA